MAASFHAALRLIFFLLNLTGHWEEALRVAGREHHPAALYGVSMKGADGDVVHLAVHKQDYSFAGFANRSGHWHVFRGDEAVLPNARRLPFSKTYRDLIGGIENVPDLPLGKAASLRVIWALSSYDADVGGGREVVKRGVATLSVVIAQAARLKPILETVDGGWESGEARMAVEHLPYIEHWDTMSFEGLRLQSNWTSSYEEKEKGR
uniref:rRNA N-glycosylase n=1 Tax=Oryza punctata TaxID=4537 RepID=A0A0E0KHL4_ORYPU